MAKDVFQYYEDYVSKCEKKDDVENEDNSELSERLGKVEQAIASVNTLLEKVIERGSEENENENVDDSIDNDS